MTEDSTTLVAFEQAKLEKIPRETKLLEARVAKARALKVVTPSDYKKAEEWLVATKRHVALVTAMKDEFLGPVNRVRKTILDAFGPLLKRYDKEVVEVISSKMSRWEVEQREAARKRELELRKLQEREAEQERKKLEAAAQKAEKNGDSELAAELREQAAEPPVPLLLMPATPPRLGGTVRRSTWKARIVDLDAVPMDFCSKVPDMTLLNALARKNEGRNAPTGVQFYEDVGYVMKRGEDSE